MANVINVGMDKVFTLYEMIELSEPSFSKLPNTLAKLATTTTILLSSFFHNPVCLYLTELLHNFKTQTLIETDQLTTIYSI